MNKTIGKRRTTKVTKEAKAKKLYSSLPLEVKNELFVLLGRIACDEVKNYYSTRIFKNITKDLTKDQRAVVTYICRKYSKVKVFENMEDLVLAEE